MRSLVVALVLAMRHGGPRSTRNRPARSALTSGPPHQASAGRHGATGSRSSRRRISPASGLPRVPGSQIFVFNLDYYDCAQGTTFPATPCPPSGTPYLVQVTNGVGGPANPSVSKPPSGSTDAFDVWVAFDALGTYGGNVGGAASRRQIFLKHLSTNEIRPGDDGRRRRQRTAFALEHRGRRRVRVDGHARGLPESGRRVAGLPLRARIERAPPVEPLARRPRRSSAWARARSHAERGGRGHRLRVDRRSPRERRRHRRVPDLLGRLRQADAHLDAPTAHRGQRPEPAPVPRRRRRRSSSSTRRRRTYRARRPAGPPDSTRSASPTRRRRRCTPHLDRALRRLRFARARSGRHARSPSSARGDPLQNFTVGPRLFVLDETDRRRSTS